MSVIDAEALMPELVAVARRAGEAILEIYADEFEVFSKDDESPLTRADLASHEVIRDALGALTPGTPVMSEESAQAPFRVRSGWREYWLVDPLDGTREFVNRNGEFTVNIALIRDHRPVAGVVHVPVREQSYWGVVGPGDDPAGGGSAWRRDGDATPVPLATRRPPAELPVVVGSRSHANPKLAERLEALGPHEMVSMGSSLKFCLVAEGSADLYPRLGPTSEWDTGAAQAVVEAAGGAVLELDGRPLAYNRKAEVLNPWFLVVGDPEAGWIDRLQLDRN